MFYTTSMIILCVVLLTLVFSRRYILSFFLCLSLGIWMVADRGTPATWFLPDKGYVISHFVPPSKENIYVTTFVEGRPKFFAYPYSTNLHQNLDRMRSMGAPVEIYRIPKEKKKAVWQQQEQFAVRPISSIVIPKPEEGTQ